MFRAIDPRSRNVAQGTPGWNRRSRRRLERAAQEVRARRLARVRGARGRARIRGRHQEPDRSRSFTGQSGKAEKTLEQHFPTPAHEEALIHSSTMKASDPAFKAAIVNIRDRVAKIPVVSNVRAANDADGSRPRFQGRPLGARSVRHQGRQAETAGDRIAPVEAAVAGRPAAHPRAAHRGVRRRQRRRADRQVGPERPEAGRDAVAAGDADHPGDRLRRPRGGRRARAARHLGRDRDDRPRGDPQPRVSRSTTTPRS